jgi:hypothetical protein
MQQNCPSTDEPASEKFINDTDDMVGTVDVLTDNDAPPPLLLSEVVTTL